jgi:hypothetical protein
MKLIYLLIHRWVLQFYFKYQFFIKVAKDIGPSYIKSDIPSISNIIANTPDIEHLVFHDIKEDFMIKQIDNISIKKQQEEMASRLEI